MKRKIFTIRVLIIALWLIIAGTGSAFADFISINNPSFEIHDPFTKTMGSREWIDSMVGWDLAAAAGTVKFEDGYYPLGIPDGVNVAFNNGGTIYQLLSATLSPNTTYELTTYVGYRPNPNIPLDACPGYRIELLAGGNVIASDDNSLYPAGLFLQSNVTYTASSLDPYLGLPLQINLISNGIQTNFDNVSLQADAVPIPSAAWLLGSGLIGLVGIRWKFRKG